jgi:hypothetical protein
MSETQDPESTARPRPDWDRVTAIAAVVIGLIAVIVSAYTALIQRAQVRAQVWPYLSSSISVSKHEITLQNKGVGPAVVRSLQVFVDGKSQPDWPAVFRAVGAKFERPPLYSTVNGKVISAGERVDQVFFQSDADFKSFLDQNHTFELKLCYCSSLDECWMRDDRETDPMRRTRAIDVCPIQGKDAFRDDDIPPISATNKDPQ